MMIWFARRFSYTPHAEDMFIRLAFLGGLFLIVNWFWTFISIKKLTINRKQRLLRLQVGNVFEEEYEIVNPIRFSRLWVEIEDLSNLPGSPGSKIISGLQGKENRFYNSRIILTRRGAFQLGPTRLRSGDIFGMFSSEKIIPGQDRLIVFPYFEKLRKFVQPPGYIQGGRSIRQKSLEATAFASGVREYQPGDPLSRIHWKTSAKKSRFMVKEFDQDPQADIWIIIDGNKEDNFQQEEIQELFFNDIFWEMKKKSKYQLPKDTFEYAISIGASLASYFIEIEKAVGMACADSILAMIPAEKGSRQLGKILDTMTYFEGKGLKKIVEVVESIGNQIVRGSTVIIVSASDISNLQVCMEILMRRKLKPILVHINKDSFLTNNFKKKNLGNSVVSDIDINFGDSISAKLETII